MKNNLTKISMACHSEFSNIHFLSSLFLVLVSWNKTKSASQWLIPSNFRHRDHHKADLQWSRTAYPRSLSKKPSAEWAKEVRHLILLLLIDTQSCPTVCDPVDCSPPGSSVHGILQAKILKWVSISSLCLGTCPLVWYMSVCHLKKVVRWIYAQKPLPPQNIATKRNYNPLASLAHLE